MGSLEYLITALPLSLRIISLQETIVGFEYLVLFIRITMSGETLTKTMTRMTKRVSMGIYLLIPYL